MEDDLTTDTLDGDPALIAWQTGVKLAQHDVPLAWFTTMSSVRRQQMMTTEQLVAWVELGNDWWAYWVRKGYGDV